MTPSPLDQARQLCQQGRQQEALRLLDQTRQKAPSPDVLRMMAEIFSSLNLHDAAWQVLQLGNTQFPDDAALALQLANLAYQINQPLRGIEITRNWIARQHCPVEIILTHAHLCKASGATDEAVTFYQQVLSKDKENAIALSSLGGLALDLCDYENAIACYERALCSDRDNPHIMVQLAYCYFRCGRLKDGWKIYAGRFGNAKGAGIVKPRDFALAPWDGNALSAGGLLVWNEQGVGEEILYSSLYRDTEKRSGQKLRVECDARLKTLFERSFPDIAFLARSDANAQEIQKHHLAAQCAAGNLGGFFRNNFSDFPCLSSPMLKADADKTAQLKTRYAAWKKQHGRDGKVIGISWKSKPLRHGDPKSTDLKMWSGVFENTPHLFISLQFGDIAEEMDWANQHHWPLLADDAIDQGKSLDDFAAQVSAMDAVITVSNTTAHMAGACGIHTAVLVPKSCGLMCHWFDVVDSKTLGTSPWYKDVTLLRQSVDGQWADVLHNAERFLKTL